MGGGWRLLCAGWPALTIAEHIVRRVHPAQAIRPPSLFDRAMLRSRAHDNVCPPARRRCHAPASNGVRRRDNPGTAIQA